MATTHTLAPLHLSGNTTEEQNKRLEACIGNATRNAYPVVIDQLDRQSTQSVLDVEKELTSELTKVVIETVLARTVSHKYEREQVESNRGYPPIYRVRPIEAQVTELRKLLPMLGAAQEKLARMTLPKGPEAWFAIPRWQAVAPSYNEAVEAILQVLAAKRRFSNRLAGRLSEKFLRQTERSKLAESLLADQQPGSDILVIAAQAGQLHRGCSARRTRSALAGNEFCLGVFAVASLLLTHPERLSTGDTLMVDCGGDEYSPHSDYTFDRVPLFDFDLSGIEFSIFYEDRARNMWGTPTAFLYKQT